MIKVPARVLFCEMTMYAFGRVYERWIDWSCHRICHGMIEFYDNLLFVFRFPTIYNRRACYVFASTSDYDSDDFVSP